VGLIKNNDTKPMDNVKVSNTRKVQCFELGGREILQKEVDQVKKELLKLNLGKNAGKKMEDIEQISKNARDMKKSIIGHFSSEKDLLEEISHFGHLKTNPLPGTEPITCEN
jgi:hypothetical protein